MDTPDILADRYRFEQPLGAGSQGSTVLATRLEDDLPVVVKSLHLARVSDWKAVELFERESKVLKGLDLEGVPRLYEYVADEGDEGPRFYQVMEFIDGQSAFDMMRDGYRFPEEEVVNVAWQVLGILEALHARNPPVVHRDVKPSNIIVRPGGAIALVDFGAVTAGSQEPSEEGGTVAGTFGYMAPEQFQGRAEPASDVFGVAATMVHLLAGKSPSSMDTELYRLDFRPHVVASDPLLDLLDRMLAPEVAHRVQTATDARTALEYVETGGEPEETEGALVPVGKIDDIEVAGQPGSMAIFHAMPPVPRKVPRSYRRQLLKRTMLYVGGGGAVAALALTGVGTLFGLGVVEIICLVALPFVLGFGLVRRGRQLKKLYRHGERAVGQVTAVRNTKQGHRVRYRFTVRGKEYDGNTRLDHVQVLWQQGDDIGVLYMTDDPEINIACPLPADTVVSALDKDG